MRIWSSQYRNYPFSLMATNGSPELLIVMGGGRDARPDRARRRAARRRRACDARVTRGREATVIGAIGERELLATLPLEGYPGVEQVLPILKPYKLVARELSPDPTVIEVDGRRIGDSLLRPDRRARARSSTASRRWRRRARSRQAGRRCCAAARSSRAPRRTPSRGSGPRRSRSCARRATRPGCRS